MVKEGKMQILFERGWIDPERIHCYTAKGNGDDSLSITKLMKKQEDFKNEETLLQYHARKLGVFLDQTGEGIEYGWALSKLAYRRSPIHLKRSKECFQQLV